MAPLLPVTQQHLLDQGTLPSRRCERGVMAGCSPHQKVAVRQLLRGVRTFARPWGSGSAGLYPVNYSSDAERANGTRDAPRSPPLKDGAAAPTVLAPAAESAKAVVTNAAVARCRSPQASIASSGVGIEPSKIICLATLIAFTSSMRGGSSLIPFEIENCPSSRLHELHLLRKFSNRIRSLSCCRHEFLIPCELLQHPVLLSIWRTAGRGMRRQPR
jgi:hypothetical protein